jgi:hypothetical protein
MALFTGLRFSRFLGLKRMGGVTAVAFVLDGMTSFAEGFSQRSGKGFVLAVFLHPLPGDGVPALVKLIELLLMTFAADLGFNG